MSEERIKVLYIDDEINNLNTFRASFRRMYEIYTASSALEARQLLDEVSVHIIVADQRMPGTTGVDFFNSIKEQHPDPIRILLTGYTDIEDLIEAINKGQIYRYIRKPWDEFDLQNALRNAYDIYSSRKQLREKMEALEKANDELNRFIYSASHDMRSPLVSVLGLINLAKMDESITDPNGYIDLIEGCVLRLDDFIKKIIEYYRNSRVGSDIENIDFNQLIRDCIEHNRHQNSQVEFDLSIDQQYTFRTDAMRLTIILNNLISNALKYQKKDEIAPYVKLSVQTTPYKALISIEDNGVGILNNHLKDIFKMFFRSNKTDNAGTGIGLYIVKEALTKIGGTIQAHSAYGQGTTFNISIPNQAKDNDEFRNHID